MHESKLGLAAHDYELELHPNPWFIETLSQLQEPTVDYRTLASAVRQRFPGYSRKNYSLLNGHALEICVEHTLQGLGVPAYHPEIPVVDMGLQFMLYEHESQIYSASLLRRGGVITIKNNSFPFEYARQLGMMKGPDIAEYDLLLKDDGGCEMFVIETKINPTRDALYDLQKKLPRKLEPLKKLYPGYELNYGLVLMDNNYCEHDPVTVDDGIHIAQIHYPANQFNDQLEYCLTH